KLESKVRRVESDARDRIVAQLDADQKKRLDSRQDKERETWLRREVDSESKRWAITFDLDDAQQSAVTAALREIQKMKSDYFPDRHAKGGRPNWEAARARMRELRAEKATRMKAILTSAQFEKFTAIEAIETEGRP